MNETISIIFLWVLFAMVLYLLKGNSTKQKIALLIIILVSSLRWDIGNDYMNMYYSAKYYSSSFKIFGYNKIICGSDSFELVYKTLIYIFRYTSNPIIWIMLVYSICTTSLWYKSLKRINGLFWGFFCILYFGILFNSWDQVKQSLAIAIFIYSIRFIEEKNPIKYILCCCLAVISHTSSIILFPVYFLSRIKLKNWIILIIITIFLIGNLTKIWQNMFLSVFTLFDVYSDYVTNKMGLQEDITSSTGTIVKTFIYLILIIFTKKENRIVSNTMFFGICIFLFACTNELLERISNYFAYTILLGLPLCVQHVNSIFKKRIIYIVISLIFFIGLRNSPYGSGCVPYDYIFSENYYHNRFRPKDY